MKKSYAFKSGFEIGEKENFFAYQLLVVINLCLSIIIFFLKNSK